MSILLDRRKALNFDIFDLVHGGIHFGDDNVGLILVLFAQLLVDRRQLFAVATPRSDECDEDCFLLVRRHFVKVLADENLDWTFVPILGHFLGEQVRLEFAVEEGVDETDQSLRGDVRRFGLEFGHFVFQGNQTNGWNIGGLQAEEFEYSLVLLVVSIDGNEECLERDNEPSRDRFQRDAYSAAEFLGSRFEFFAKFLVVAALLAVEEEDVNFDFTAEDLLCRLDERQIGGNMPVDILFVDLLQG